MNAANKLALLEDFDLSLFFWHSQDLMCVAGHDGYFKKVNPAFVNLLGYTERELLSKPYIEFVHPEDLRKTTTEADDLKDKDGSLYFENRYVCKDGSIRHLSWKSSKVGEQIFAIARDVTHIKETEAAFRDNERRLSLLLENVPVTLFVLDSSGNLETTIGKGRQLAGYSNNEDLGENVLLRHQSRPDICGPIKNALSGQRSSAQVTFDGLDYEVFYEPVLNAEGLVDHVVGLSVIVTGKTNLENELQYRQLANSLPQIIWTARPDGYIDYYNNRWYEFTGFERGTIGGQSREEILHPEDLSVWRTLWSKSLKSGEPYEIEYRFKDRLNGGYRW